MHAKTTYTHIHYTRHSGLSNVIAALCSFFFPGLGQLLQARIFAAAFFFLTTTVLYTLSFLLIPFPIALLMHLWAIINAAAYDGRN